MKTNEITYVKKRTRGYSTPSLYKRRTKYTPSNFVFLFNISFDIS